MDQILSYQNSKIVLSLINLSYSKFKEVNPNEEPFWKISCFKKIRRPIIHDKSELSMNWRQIESKNGDVKVSEIKEIKNIKQTRTRSVTKSQEIRRWAADNDFKAKTVRGKPTITNETTTFEDISETYISDINSRQIDVRIQYDQPDEVNIIKVSEEFKLIQEKIEILGIHINDTIITNKDLNMINIKDIIDESRVEINRLRDRVNFLENQSLTLMTQIHEIELEKKELRNREIDFSKLNNVIKKNWTVMEVIDKYAEIQTKLNEAKQSINNTLKKHTKLKYDELLKANGFIGSLKYIIQYFDSQYDDESDYDEHSD